MTSDSSADLSASGIAAAIGEPARARILFSLMDGHARTSTELAVIAEVSPSTASVHLSRLKEQMLVNVFPQGKHRYYSLSGQPVAALLETLNVMAGTRAAAYESTTPKRLRAARTCYDHMAGSLGVGLHDGLARLGWIAIREQAYQLTDLGCERMGALGIDACRLRNAKRRLAYPCMDWSERRPHLGGSLASALFQLALEKRWVLKDCDSRALTVTSAGRRVFLQVFGLHLD